MELRDLERAFISPRPSEPGLGWYRATVTQVSPLRVQFDTDDTPHAATPDTGVSDLAVGDVVWCVFSGGRVLIVMKIRTALRTAADCNTALDPGTWIVSGDVSGNNRPPNSHYGILHVSNPGTLGYTGDVVQIFYGYGNVARVWYRRYWQVGPVWSPWRMLGGAPDVVTARSTDQVGPGAAWGTLYGTIEASLPFGVWDVMAGASVAINVNTDSVMLHLVNRADNAEIGDTSSYTASRGASAVITRDTGLVSLTTSRVILTVTEATAPLRVGIACHPNGNSSPVFIAWAGAVSQWITAVRIG